MTALWIRFRIWLAHRLLDLGLIDAAKWVARGQEDEAMTEHLYWARVLLCRCLLAIAECAFALAGAVAPDDVKRLRRPVRGL
jgi:hypothetical protein